MAILDKLQRALDAEQIRYEVHSHPEAMTARSLAAADHVADREVAKVVIVRADEQMQMLVLPASHRVELHALRELLGVRHLRLANEGELGEVFAQCEVGAMPPFGNFWQMPVWVDDRLRAETEIVFAGGNHHETVHMAYSDFERMVHPRHASFASLGS
jgi:Ala-tRNA(Pro) deacylase